MPRTRYGVARHRRKKRLFKRAKGYWGGRSKLYRTARETNNRAMRFSFAGRKQKKRVYRSLWITRINAALIPHQMNYSTFMGALKHAKVELNRKVIAEMAIQDPQGFARLVEVARQNSAAKPAKQ